MVSPWFSYCVYIMHLKKTYKSCHKLSVTVVVLQFCDILGATLGNNLIKLVCRLTSALHHFVSFTLSGALLVL